MVQKVSCTLLRGTYRLEGGFRFSACHRPPRRLRGEGALQAEPCGLQAEAACSGSPTPGPGWDWCLQRCVGSGPQKVVSFVGSRSGAVGFRQQCGASTAPASWRTPNASRPRRCRADMEGRVPPRPLARVEPGPPPNRYPWAGVEPGPPLGMWGDQQATGSSGESRDGAAALGRAVVLRQRQQAGALQTLRDLGGAVRTGRDAFYRVRWRDAFHRVPWSGWNRALHRILTTGPGCKPAFQGDAISTGGSRGAWGWSCRRAVAGGETVARRGSPSAGAPAAEERSECATVQEWAGPWGGGYELGGRMRVHSRGPASFGLGPWRDSGGFGDPLVYRAPAPAVSAQPPRQPVQKLKCAAPKECGCRGLDLEGRAD